MQGDGSYVRPASGQGAKSCQQLLIDLAEKRQREASRLKRRRPQGFARRPIK
jgi:polyphosphate kinase